jgi:HTH-type transcriptional regulator / antitoxin HigA
MCRIHAKNGIFRGVFFIFTQISRGLEDIMNINPIKTNADYEATLKEIERLWESKPGTPAGDKLDILVTLVERYEQIHYPIDPPDPVEAIKFRMEQQGLTRRDLAPLMGGKNRVSEVLNRRRSLSRTMILKLHESLKIPYESLINSSEYSHKKRGISLALTVAESKQNYGTAGRKVKQPQAKRGERSARIPHLAVDSAQK